MPLLDAHTNILYTEYLNCIRIELVMYMYKHLLRYFVETFS